MLLQDQENAGDTANRQPDGNAAMDIEEVDEGPLPDRCVSNGAPAPIPQQFMHCTMPLRNRRSSSANCCV